MNIIDASKNHYQEIIDIYNWAISNTTATFDTETKTLNSYSQFLDSLKNYPFIVSLNKDNKVTGWACLKPYSDRKAYDQTVELSVYIEPSSHGKGIGSKLMTSLIDEAYKKNYHTILSRITAESEASIKLHEKFGFFTVGTMKEVGEKFNRRIDVILMQKVLDN